MRAVTSLSVNTLPVGAGDDDDDDVAMMVLRQGLYVVNDDDEDSPCDNRRFILVLRKSVDCFVLIGLIYCLLA